MNRGLLKKLHRLAKRSDIDLWSLDECHFQQHGSRIAMWVPPEDKDPTLLLAPTRNSISLFGSVNVRDGRLVTHFEKKFNAMSFQSFLYKLLRHRRKEKRIVVILDNAKYHHAQLLKPFLCERKDKLSLEFLPSYSPELNPIERVWKLIRKICVHDVYFPSLEDLQNNVSTQLMAWKKPNKTLYKLCSII
jgi:transposase